MPTKETQKILIIDDEPDTRIFMLNLLTSHGYNSISAENRVDGLEKAIAEDPMVIIIDMMMPGKGGIQLYRELKREKKLKKVPVIMLSTIEKKTFFKLRGVGRSPLGAETQTPEIYLQKPHETEELLKIIKKISGARVAQPKRRIPKGPQ